MPLPVSAVFGASITYCFFIKRLVAITQESALAALLLALLLSAIFSGLSYLLLFRYALPRLAGRGIPGRGRLAWLALTLLAGFYLVYTIPLEMPKFFDRQSLEIIALGEKNSAAQDSRVSIASLTYEDGLPFVYDQLTQSGGWQQVQGALVAAGGYPQRLTWEGEISQKIILVFHTGPQSGKVRVIFSGKGKTTDLYAKQTGEKQVVLAPEQIDRSADLVQLYVVSATLTLGLIVFLASVALFLVLVAVPGGVGQPAAAPEKRPAWRRRVLYMLPLLAAWTIFLMTFWPGAMTPDSVDQWGQMQTMQINDSHPAIHTLSIWLITRLWESPAAVALVQIIALSAVVAWGVSLLNSPRLFLPGWAAAGLVLLFAISPVNLSLVITLWKDIPYSIALFALSLLVLQIVASDGGWLKHKYAGVVLGLVVVATATYRHNGSPVALGTLLLLLLVYRSHWRQLAIGLTTLIVMWTGVRYGLYSLLNIQPDSDMGTRRLIFQIAAHLEADTELTRQQAEVLSRIRPLQDNWGYDCFFSGSIIFDKAFNWDEFYKYRAEIPAIYMDTLRRNPRVNLDHILCNGSLVWSVYILPRGYMSTHAFYQNADGQLDYIYRNPYGIKAGSLLPGLKEPLYESYVQKLSNMDKWDDQLLWRPAAYLYLAILLTAVLALRFRNWRYLLFVFPIVLHSAVLFTVNGSQSFRYQYPVYLVGLFSLSFIFLRQYAAPQQPEAEHQASECKLQ
ncbi:MAG: hypothetical protein ACKOC5_03895 [Chloroflexota bacterium]